MLELFQNFFAPPRHLILLVIASWFGLAFAERRASQHNVSKDNLNNITFYGLLGFLIGGRISFVLQNIQAFARKPLDIISINTDIFDTFGGLVVALIVTFAYGQRKELKLWSTMDALTPFFAMLAIGIGLSHLSAGTSFGKETDLPWAINLWNADRHPTQIYETLGSFLTFGFIWIKKPTSRPGILFLTFATLTAFIHLFLEAFHGDSIFIINGIRQNQITYWIVLTLSFILIEMRIVQTKKSGG